MSNNNSAVLTAEQKAQIEKNRKQALERLEARTRTVIKSINPVSKSNAASSHRPSPYLLKKPTNQHNNKPSNCTIELISDERFQVKTTSYNPNIIQIFKKIPSATYHAATKLWSFRLSDYNELVIQLESSIDNIICNKIPDFVIKAITESNQIAVDENKCLEQIEDTLTSTLLDFQKSGICFGISHKGRCMIADDMGLGKSRQALGIADFYRDDWPLLIVTNASTRHFWAKEVENLLSRLSSNDISIFQASRDFYDNANYENHVVICSYNNLQTNVEYLTQMAFGVIIFDESHNLKNEKAKQTVNAEIISKKAHRIIMLTGTPALSRPVELFTQLKILDNKNTFNYYQFTTRYCNGHQTSFGWNASGCSNLEELNILLKKKFMIRRVKSEVFLELSNKKRELVYLENYEYTSSYDDEMQELSSQFSEAKNNCKFSENILLNWYQLTSKVKAFGASIFVRRFLQECECKILVFCHHNFMMNAICAEIEKTNIAFVHIDGKVSGSERAKRVQEFQENSNVRVAVLSIKACNAGITLTAASTVIFCEFDWNPSTIIQAEARAHRIGQENEVKVYFLMAQNTSDSAIWELLNSKQTKLGKAGLVANIENLCKNIKVSTFDVQQAKKFIECNDISAAKPEPFLTHQNKVQSKVNYFDDDDIDDEELLRIVENLP